VFVVIFRDGDYGGFFDLDYIFQRIGSCRILKRFTFGLGSVVQVGEGQSIVQMVGY